MYNYSFFTVNLSKKIKQGLFFLGLLCFTNLSAHAQSAGTYGKQALEESVVPIRPGEPGKTPFWNEYANQFIYAPAFDYKLISKATKYRYEIKCGDNSEHDFESNVPYSPLSRVWISMPTGFFNLKVIALNAKGDSIGLGGSGKYYKAAYFNGPYHKPVMPYDESAKVALDSLLKQDYVEYWLGHKEPDPNYINYRYPAKMMSALIVGAVTHARLKPNTSDAERSGKLARIIADYLIRNSYEKGSVWEYFPPSYSRTMETPQGKPHMKHANNFTIIGADGGNAFLDLYDYTKDVKYLEAAKRIAGTYLKTQLGNGSWYQFVDYKTGKPIAPNIAIPTAVINYFDRLKRDYKVKGLEQPTAKAFKWIMDNPVKTFNWQGQFEDITAKEPYRNQSREQACDLAIYLFKNNKNIELAEELVRFSEDQFVIWENAIPTPVGKSKNPAYTPTNWITPCVLEQYAYRMPVGRAAGIMVETYWQAYHATKKDIYLAQARSIANAFTLMQKEYQGNYASYFTKYPMDLWLNSTVYPAKVLMDLENNLNKN